MIIMYVRFILTAAKVINIFLRARLLLVSKFQSG
jgi:cell division protein FtsL